MWQGLAQVVLKLNNYPIVQRISTAAMDFVFARDVEHGSFSSCADGIHDFYDVRVARLQAVQKVFERLFFGEFLICGTDFTEVIKDKISS